MKKLMIAVAIVCAASASQAALSMTWGTGKMYKPYTGTPTTEKKDGDFTTSTAKSTVTAYLFELNAATFAELYVEGDYAASALNVFNEYATVNGSSFTVTGATASDTTGSSTHYKNFTDSKTYSNGDTAYAAMILKYTDTVKGDYYIANIASYEFKADANGNSKNFGVYQFSDGNASKLTGWTAVPEPTSAMLMLLGVAGLALRRRRA